MITTVLVIVSDEDKYSRLHERLTQAYGGKVNIFRLHAYADVTSVNASNINFVIVDMLLPVQGNVPVLQLLRGLFRYTPILVITDNYHLPSQMNAVKNGAQDVLVWADVQGDALHRAMAFAAERCSGMRKNDLIADEYKKHFDAGPIPMWVIDTKTMRFLLVNNAAVQKYGYTKAEFYTMTVPDILAPEDKGPMLETYERRAEEYFDAGYWRHKKKNGTTFYVHIYAHSTTFNHIDARLCFSVDVDKQLQMNKRNEELMALITEQKQQLDNLLVSITDALWTRNAETLELLYGNHAYFKLHGYTLEEMTPNRDFIFKAVYPDDHAIIAGAYADIIEKGSADVMYRYIHKDGSIKTLRVQAVLKTGEDGKPDTINGITIDITKEKELLDKIQDSEHKLKATINNTKDLIWSVDTELCIIFCNQPYKDFFKWLCDKEIHEGDYVLADWRTDEFKEQRVRDYQRALNGASFITEIIEQKDGTNLYFEISSSPIRDRDGRVIGVNCISRNVTEQKINLHKIQRQNDKLLEIAWVQSHKVRGPVANILGLISLFDIGRFTPDDHGKALVSLKAATEELDKIIREVVASANEVAHDQNDKIDLDQYFLNSGKY